MHGKLSAGKCYCMVSAAIILGSYIIQRTLHICCNITREFVIAEAFAFSLAVAVVLLLVIKSKEGFYGILTAIFGLRMMPPDISGLEKLSPEANIVYFLVQKFSVFIFAAAVLWMYERQEKPKQIKSLPILCTIFAVPFFMGIQSQVSAYINSVANGNMLYSYFTGFIFYSFSMLILLFTATRSNSAGARLIADYQMVALLLNFSRRICAIVINFARGNHISRSYYCWVLIYIFFFAVFSWLRTRKEKNTAKEMYK